MSLYSASIPVFEQMLTALSAIIDKAAAHAGSKKIEPAALLQARLFPDMFSFAKQVQVACDFAARGAARLGGGEVPNWPHDETDFAGLKARIDRTLALVRGCDRATVDAAANRDISLPMRTETLTINGAHFLHRFCLPHFYFHVTCAYALLRHNGVELGKGDYMGSWKP
jgi:hypothetical protein